MRHNIELKARLGSLEDARSIARRVATSYLGIQDQTDTYFECQTGRLKLREILGEAAQLIWYSRPDQAAAKESRYMLVDVPDAAAIKQALASACGVWRVVAKRREIYMFDTVRIHLDRVDRLGDFIEFEAVLDDGVAATAGHAAVARLTREFGLGATDLRAGSYSDIDPESVG